MGAINYGTSEYITIGFNLSIFTDSDEAFNTSVDYYAHVTEAVDNLANEYFSVDVCEGYYDGFYITITPDLYIPNREARQDATAEALRVCSLLKYAVCECCCCEVSPGWCTGYATETESIEAINIAYADMLMDILDSYKHDSQEAQNNDK